MTIQFTGHANGPGVITDNNGLYSTVVVGNFSIVMPAETEASLPDDNVRFEMTDDDGVIQLQGTYRRV